MIYKCTACGYRWDEEAEGKSVLQLRECPLCGHGPECFVPALGIPVPLARPENDLS